jgi:hypothetical protein
MSRKFKCACKRHTYHKGAWDAPEHAATAEGRNVAERHATMLYRGIEYLLFLITIFVIVVYAWFSDIYAVPHDFYGQVVLHLADLNTTIQVHCTKNDLYTVESTLSAIQHVVDTINKIN